MLEATLVLIGMCVGGIICWFWASARTRASMVAQLSSLQTDCAVAEQSLVEARQANEKAHAEIDRLRVQLDEQQQARISAETRLSETVRHFEEQKKLLEESEKKFKEVFESLSARALRANAEQFQAQARKTLETVLSDARGDLGKRQEAIQGLVKPLNESLKRLEEHTRSVEQLRQKAYGSLEEQVKSLTMTNSQLQQETGKLVTSLRNPRVRGQWGEMALRRAAELAGMARHCDFIEQASVTGQDAMRYRPDMVVHLPGGRTVAIDAKAVLDAYLDAVAATDEDQKQEHLKRHAAQVASRVRELASKRYWDHLDQTPEFVVLFLPAESFFSAAVDTDPALIETAVQSRVVLASPTTLIALLKAIAFGWQQQQVAENAEAISQLGRDLYDRMGTLADHLATVGTRLGSAVDSYNKAVGSLERRVLPSARKFKELGAGGSKEIASLESVDHVPRQPSLPETAEEDTGVDSDEGS